MQKDMTEAEDHCKRLEKVCNCSVAGILTQLQAPASNLTHICVDAHLV